MLALVQNCCLSAGNISADPTLTSLVGGLRAATFVLLAVPWALVAGIGWWWWRRRGAVEDAAP